MDSRRHRGLTEATAATLPGAAWHRCDSVWARHQRVVDQVEVAGFSDAAHLDEAAVDLSALPGVPRRTPATDLIQQPPRTIDQRDPAPHRCGRDLPHPGVGHPTSRGSHGRPRRRIDHRPPVHQPRIPDQTRIRTLDIDTNEEEVAALEATGQKQPHRGRRGSGSGNSLLQ